MDTTFLLKLLEPEQKDKKPQKLSMRDIFVIPKSESKKKKGKTMKINK